MKIILTALSTVALGGLLAVVLPVGAAHADETHSHAHNGSRFTLIHIGQIDDPAEDVLEHLAIFGTTYVRD